MNVKNKIDTLEQLKVNHQKIIKDSLGDRYNNNKPKWSLVSWKALEPMVRVLEFGAQKYAPFNWMKGLNYSETCDSLLRHTHAFLEGEDTDPESKLEHTAHIMCNAMFLSYMFLFRKDLDDRHKQDNGNT